MADIKTDLYQKGYFRQVGPGEHVSSLGAQNHMYVRDVTPNLDNVREAISLARANAGVFHRSDEYLPPALIEAVRLKADTYKVIVTYRRGPGTTPTRSATQLTGRQSLMASFPWYLNNTSHDGNGRPDGPVTFEPYYLSTPISERIPRPWTWSFGVTRLRPRTIIPFQPSLVLTQLQGTINANFLHQFVPSEVGGWYAPTVMYFEGYTSRAIETDPRVGSMKYEVTYSLLFNPHGWRRMLPPRWDHNDSLWRWDIIDAHRRKNWPVFPTH